MRNLETVRISDVDLNDTSYCARLNFTPEDIKSLVNSIEQLGLRNPPGYIRKGNRLIVNYGWRRTFAIRELGWAKFEAWIYNGLTEEEAHLQNISDNVDRENLSTLEVAGKVRKLRDIEIPIEKIAERLNKGTQHIYDLLKLTTMPQEIQLAVHKNEISLYHAIEIFKFPDSKRLEILQRTLDEKLSVSALKRLRRGDFAPSISERTEENLKQIVAEATEKGLEITYEELVEQIRPLNEKKDSSNNSRRVWKSHRGWVVDIPYDWKLRQEEQLGKKLYLVNVEEREDGSLIITPKGGSRDG